MKRPFLSVFICFMIGISFRDASIVNINLKLLLPLALLLGVAIFILQDKKYFSIFLVFSLVFLLGVAKRDIDQNKSILKEFYNKEVSIVAVVEDSLKEEGYEKHIVLVEKLKDDRIYSVDERLQTSIYENTNLKIGDRVLLKLKINEPMKNRNPYLFNSKKYLQSRGIYAVSSIKPYNIKLLSRDNLSFLTKLQLRVSKHIKYSLDKSLSVKNSGTLKSIILGDKTHLDEDYIKDFRKLGLSHILAVSGLHIGIIFASIMNVFALFKVHKRIAMMYSLLIIWIYASLIGFPPSVLRASIMFSFLILARLIHVRYDAVNILSFAGLIMLVYRTSYLFSIGFQLSFLATLTILIFIPKLQEIISIKNPKLKSATVVVIAAQIGVLPISLYYFNEFQTLSVISNVIIAPLLSISIVIGFIIIPLSLFSVPLSIAVGTVANFILNIASLCVDVLSKISYLNFTVHSPSLIEITLYYIALFLLLEKTVLEKMSFNIKRCLYVNFFVVLTFGVLIGSTDETVRVQFIDVGQGDSALVKLKDKNLLIDTGGSVFGKFDVGESVLLPYLKKSGVRKLDGVFLSHFDADHVKGLLALFEEVKIDTIFIGYKNPENALYREIIESAKKHGVEVCVITRGDKLKIDKVSRIEVLHPSLDVSHYSDENDKSLVFILKLYDREIVFTGDIEEKSEDYIVENTRKRKIDIIKVPHHGSKTSSKAELIELFSPSVAVIQLGKNNFGHPNSDVLDRYKKANAHILRNDLSGLIEVEITSKEMKFSNYLREEETIDIFSKKNLILVVYAIYSGYIYEKMLKYRQTEDEKSLRC